MGGYKEVVCVFHYTSNIVKEKQNLKSTEHELYIFSSFLKRKQWAYLQKSPFYEVISVAPRMNMDPHPHPYANPM